MIFEVEFEEGLNSTIMRFQSLAHFWQTNRPAVAPGLALLCWAGFMATSYSEETAQPVYQAQSTQITTPSTSARPTIRLEGKAEVQQYTNIAAWQASQNYRQGVTALGTKDYNVAAEYFRRAGAGFAISEGSGKFLAEARYAEGQARRLMKQNAQAGKLFGEAVDLFRKYDLGSPFLKAAVDYRNALTKPLHGKVTRFDSKFSALPAQMDTVDRHVVLKGKVTRLEDGTKIAALKDDEFFNGGSKRLLPEAAGVDVSEGYVHNSLFKAFAKMNCLEWAELGGNLYTAPDNYFALKASGKTAVIGASDQFWSPVIQLVLNGHQYGICMDLPGMSAYSHNVLVVTDGQHVLAIDPRTYDTWKLTASFAKRRPEFNWSKLTHTKRPTAITGSNPDARKTDQ